jgi:hypothetical protein
MDKEVRESLLKAEWLQGFFYRGSVLSSVNKLKAIAAPHD